MAAIQAGGTYTGVLAQYAWTLPYVESDVEVVAENIKAIAVVASKWSDDIVVDYSGGKYHHEGREAVVAWIKKGMGAETFLSSHKMHHPEITLTGPGGTAPAQARSTVRDPPTTGGTYRSRPWAGRDRSRTGKRRNEEPSSEY